MCFLLNDSHPLHKSMFWVAQQKRKKNNKPMSKKTDKEKLPNLFVGQVLYYQIKRNNNEIPIAEAKVVKVGRDYFYAEIGHRQVQFYKANMLSTNTRIKLYTSKQYIIDEITAAFRLEWCTH